MSGFKVLQPGMLTLIHDAGRFGHHRIGLTNGGPLDALAFNWANRLCGNLPGTTALEVSIGGLVLEAEVATQIVVTGAEMALTINREPKELWRGHRVQPGDRIEVAFSTNGARAYLAVAGGFNVPAMFDSTSTVTRETLGGFDGGPLKQGDLLPCTESSATDLLCLNEQDRPTYSNEVTLRVIPGYQQQAFTRFQQRLFFSCQYTVSDRCDRMGYRLEGAEIKPSIDGILSEGICYGAIQVPADGQPIVLLNDRQTIGGYPKIGSVLSLDIARLAQLLPGGKVSFEAITIDHAHNLLHLAQSRYERTTPEVCEP